MASVLIAASTASFIIMNSSANNGLIANIYQNGECIHSIDLSAVDEPYTVQIDGAVTNIVAVEKGRIRVSEATCPDHICIRQGWISNGIVPIVCLPNNLVVQIEGAALAEVDAVSQ